MKRLLISLRLRTALTERRAAQLAGPAWVSAPARGLAAGRPTAPDAKPKGKTAKAATKARSAAATAKADAKLASSEAENTKPKPVKAGGGSRRAKATDYSRQTPREHVLLRPQMYVGSTERVPAASAGSVLHGWDFEPGEGGGRVVLLPPDPAQSFYSPALCKVFDEILVNAADNRLRDKNTTLIEVVLDPLEPRITVTNNGRGLPVERHAAEGLWVPELVFGHLLTGSNFDDGPAAGGGSATEKDAKSLSLERLTGGRHGYGAKLANILAHEFTVDT